MSWSDYARLAVIGVAVVISLSLTHDYWGDPYSKVVMNTAENFTASNVVVWHEDSMIWVTVNPSDVEAQRKNILAAAKGTVDEVQLARFVDNGDEGIAFTQSFRTKEMSYWLITTVVLLLAVPMLTIRKRLAYLLMALTMGFVGNVVGLYLVVDGQSVVVNDPRSLDDWKKLVQLLSFGMLVVPSLVWAPAIVGIFRAETNLSQ